MMNNMGGMMWGMGLVWLIIVVVLVLAAAALVKYLFFRGLKAGASNALMSCGLADGERQ